MFKVLTPFFLIGSLAVAAVLTSPGQPQAADKAEFGQPFNIVFVNFCDGMNLSILRRSGKVSGVRTGCASGRVKGFVSAEAVSVADSRVQWDIYTSGQFAGRFFLFTKQDGNLVNQGTWAPALTAGSDTLGDTPTDEDPTESLFPFFND